MKRIIIGIAAFALTLGVVAGVTQTSESLPVLVTREALLETEAVKTLNALVVDVAALVAAANTIESAPVVQADTNVNVNVTLTTPSRVGAILIAPNGTNLYAAVARGATTNDWVVIAGPTE
jgi:hypothetical protein